MYNEQMIQELRKRWNALQQALAREGGDAILITTNVNEVLGEGFASLNAKNLT